ncbi:MAG: GNAT family N-acetyltransferase [Defluviitaleaceae bacterium]|nr:GNAT family N-acetyltransferase [Defluviitaleaceae bacterium]
MVYLDKGYIGNFDAKTPQELREYLKLAIEQLGDRQIIAPIDGSTWHSYRLMSWSGDFPPFPMEPQNPLWYNDVYKELGFTPLATYHSVAFDINNIEELKHHKDVEYKTFEQHHLHDIHKISTQGFEGNFLYEHISYNDFFKLYQPLLPMLDKDFVLTAYVDGEPAGFIFAFGAADCIILKTIAVLPKYFKFGIGRSLVNKVLLKAEEKGFKTAIGALIIGGNISSSLVKKYNAKKIREYTLYEYTRAGKK